MHIFQLLTLVLLNIFNPALPSDEKEKGNNDTMRMVKQQSDVWWEYDSTVIPCFDMYENVWDPLNVNVPGFDPATLGNEGVWLCLREKNDCEYIHPYFGEINSEFGWRWDKMHNGVDIDLEIGEPVYAAFDGVVRISKENPGGYGLYVMVRHYNGLETLYGHLSERLVDVNQPVRAGDIIGYGGNTGRSTGPHLHFEVRFKGTPIDPRKFISFENGELLMDTVVLDQSFFHYPTNHVAKAPVKAKYYKVKSGDTLWKIAKNNGLTVKQLCKMNHIREHAVLPLGKKLKVK